MKNVDFLIIGSSAAGTTAADILRSSSNDVSITVVSEEAHAYYSKVILPNYIKGKITKEQVIFKNAEWFKQKNIELLESVRAEKLDANLKQVTLSNGEVYQFDKLLLAVGGKTITFNIPGADLEKICYFSTLDDSDYILKAIPGAKKAIVIGGGFIGLELLEIFKVCGISEVTVLVMEPYYWFGKLDEDSSMVMTRTLEKNGIHVIVEEQANHFEPKSTVDGGKTVGAVVTKTGNRYEADIVGIGIGIRPKIEWLKDSGLEINRGIMTNEFMETSLPDVYAAGDCAEFNDILFERRHILGIWANAVSQGGLAAKNMLFAQSLGKIGQKTTFETTSSYTSNFFDGSCSFVGVTDEKFADEEISRGSVESGKMTRIFMKRIKGVLRIVGATVVNSPIDVAPLTLAIKGKVDVSTIKEKLSDVNFNLMDLVR